MSSHLHPVGGEAGTTLPCGNRLLSLLKGDELQTLLPMLEQIQLPLKQVLYEPDKTISHVYFPCTSVVSVLATMHDGGIVEVGTIGNEGFTNVDLLLGGVRSTQTVLCQINGSCLRMTAADFKAATLGDTPLRRVTQRYLLAYLSQVSQSTACNRLHIVEARFARWVLMTHDRVEGDSFVLTQEFLAEMLGVLRPTVSLVAGTFQNAGLIQYKRGQMTILDRNGLEEIACECYGIVKKQFDLLLGNQAN